MLKRGEDILKLKNNYLLSLFLFLPILLFSCSNQQAVDPPANDQLNVQNINYSANREDQVIQSVRNQFDEVAELTSLTHNGEILMGIEVKPLSQFNEQKIAKDIEQFLFKENPDKQAIVSSDFKVSLEINRLKDEIQRDELTITEINERFKKIKEYTKTSTDE